ncbi:polysaccharide pyruvyl transferase family protein [Paenibacillus thiaminolyticus]|uniref:Polysaccharide pyruvyl transferase domain-containing protein n=1 Tax=Paenibacillus thiaminolyticus TaxID=49283 RepID=A0A3A3GKL9_PANTH|nr:polysaccharide pyruvyl transferase family protein [Paenibacillus thiaminolyticus]RJG23084.1 hypothetical protein DQX05_14500 [Paenibacillus thiaminolyticus]
MKRILYLGEIGYHNAGDQVMWDVFRHQFNKHLQGSRFEVAGSLSGGADPLAFDAVVLGGGSLIAPTYLAKLAEADKGNKPYYIWGSGVDKLVSKKGLDAMLNGTPLPAKLIAQSIHSDVFQRARFTAVRGPLSQAFLQMGGVAAENIAVSGDPALLLTPEDAKPVSYEPPLPRDRPYIGINWGTAMNLVFGHDEASVEDKLVRAAKEWIRQGYSILMFVMWPHDIAASRRMMHKIGCKNRVRLFETVNPYQLMSIIGQCKFTVDFKLHAAVLSAVMRIPFIALGYRFKVFDFAASIDALPYVLSTDSSTLDQKLLQLSTRIEENYTDTVNEIDRQVFPYQKKKMLAEPFFRRLQKEVETN